jgi:nitroreductase
MAQDASSHIQFLRRLRAVREYTSEPISDEALNDILEVGRWSGSASNSQMTEIVVVSNPDIRQKITDGGVRAAAGSALALVIVTAGDSQRRDLEIFDEGRLVERLLLAASAHGLGANIGTLKGEGPAVVKEALGVPTERRAWSVVTLGHIDRPAFAARTRNPRAGRKPLNEFVHWERYGSHR